MKIYPFRRLLCSVVLLWIAFYQPSFTVNLSSLAAGLERSSATFQSCLAKPAGLIAWWPGDGNANDIEGTNNGVLQNGATFATGLVGQAFNFNGFGDSVQGGFVSIADSASLRTPAVSFEGWFFLRRQPTGVGVDEFVLASKYDGQYHGWILRVGSDLKPYFSVHRDGNAGGLAHAISSVPITLNIWIHIAGTYDGTTAQVYVNGVQKGSQQMAGGYAPTTVPMKIGAASWYSGGYSDCLVDEASFYGRALLAQEIQTIYQVGTSGKCKTQICASAPAGLIAWWSGDGNANDIRGNNNGMLQGGITFATGKVGEAFSFGGSGEIRVASNPTLNVQAFAIDAWVYPTLVDGTVDIILTRKTRTKFPFSMKLASEDRITAGVWERSLKGISYFTLAVSMVSQMITQTG